VSGYRAGGCAGYAVVRAFREPDRGAIGIADADADCDAECDTDGRPDVRAKYLTVGHTKLAGSFYDGPSLIHAVCRANRVADASPHSHAILRTCKRPDRCAHS
jgi:hypothetical protein